MSAIRSSPLLAVVLWFGCHPPEVTVQGRALREAHWKRDVTELEKRARFEFKCAEAPRLTLLEVSCRFATSVGVELCGQRGVYVRHTDAYCNPSTWSLNSIGGRPSKR